MGDKHYDTIVIGAGSAGSVVARRLHDAGQTVLLIEAGGEDTNPAIAEPSRMHELWHSAEDWDYYTVSQPNAADRSLHLPRGKVVGGSHALNGMIYVRCSPEDFDGWARAGNVGWEWEHILPLYRALENFDGGPSDFRGVGGMLDVVRNYRLNPIQDAIIEAAVAAGIPRNDDYNSATIDGVSSQQVTMRDGKRLTSYGAYVRPILASDRLRVATGGWVCRLIIADGCVAGVEFEYDGARSVAHADQVVLSAGAIDSPLILMRSGIGPAETLDRLGIAVEFDSPEVGQNLQDHFLAPVIFATESRPVPPLDAGVGLMQSHLFARSDPALALPDLQPVFFSRPAYEPWMTGPDSGFTLMAGIVSPASRGSVTLSGPEIRDRPIIDLNLFDRPEDLACLMASVRLCETIGAADPLASDWGARQLYPQRGLDDAGLAEYVRRTAVTYHHAAGTCRMGVDGQAVVDPELRVRGISGLRIADASIMPTITAGNTNAPTIVIGEQAARFMLGR